MTSIVILAVLIAIVVFVLRMKPAEVSSAEAATATSENPLSKSKTPFVLSERGKTIVLAISSGLIGLIISMYLNPLVVLVVLAAGGFFAFYRTAKGKETVDKRMAELKALAARSAASAKAGAQALAEGQAESEAAAKVPTPAQPQSLPARTEQLVDQIVSATRVARTARKTLDAELLPSLAAAGDEAEKAVIAGAIANSRATLDQARKLAERAIGQLAANLAADPQGAEIALGAALEKESVAEDAPLAGMFRHMQSSAEMARFDEAGYARLLQDIWLRATENPGLSNSPV